MFITKFLHSSRFVQATHIASQFKYINIKTKRKTNRKEGDKSNNKATATATATEEEEVEPNGLERVNMAKRQYVLEVDKS